MGTERDVVSAQQVRLADAGRLLTIAQVRGAGIGGFHAVVVGLRLDLREHVLKLTADSHVAIDADQIFFGVVALFQFLLDGLVILADGNVLKVDITRLTDGNGINV